MSKIRLNKQRTLYFISCIFISYIFILYFYFQFILLLLVSEGFCAPKPQDSYGSPQAPAVDSYGAPQAPVCRTEHSPSEIPGAQCSPDAPQCVDQVML
jgi:hypothetical protein